MDMGRLPRKMLSSWVRHPRPTGALQFTCEPLRVWRDLPRVRAEAAAAAAESSTARAISSESDSWRYRALPWRLKNADAHAQHIDRASWHELAQDREQWRVAINPRDAKPRPQMYSDIQSP